MTRRRRCKHAVSRCHAASATRKAILAGAGFESLEERTVLNGDFGFASAFVGTESSLSFSITNDAVGNSYSTGLFRGTVDFDPGAGVANLTAFGVGDAYISKLDSGGNLEWARRIGGRSSELSDSGVDIALDSSGNVIVTGSFSDTVDFDPGPGTFELTSVGRSDVFVMKLNGSGNFVWAKQFETTEPTPDSFHRVDGIAVDSSDNIITTGTFAGTADFDPGPGTFTLSPPAGGPGEEGLGMFFSKLNSSGDFVWAKQVTGTVTSGGGFTSLEAAGLDVDGADNVYIAGKFTDTPDFDPGPGVFEIAGASSSYDLFVMKLSDSGDFIWAKAMLEGRNDRMISLAVDDAGSVAMVGDFRDTVDFDPGPGTFNLTSVSGVRNDGFVSKLDSSGNFLWARQLHATEGMLFGDVAIDGNGAVYSTGSVIGTADFEPGGGVSNLTSAGFVWKLNGAGNFAWVKGFAGASGRGISTTSNGFNVYVTGNFAGTVDFDPGPNTFNLTSGSNANPFCTEPHDIVSR